MAQQTGARDAQTTTRVRQPGTRPKVALRKARPARSATVRHCIEELTRLTLDIKQQLRLSSH